MNRRQFLSGSVTALSLFLAVASTFAAQEQAEVSTPGAAADGGVQQDRLAWFRQARFGMFIHWGPYSELAGEWKGRRVEVGRNAKWIMKFLQIPAAEYRELARQFNPVKFAAEAWVRLAQATGMRYLIVTAKHHDGFAMYHSRVIGDYQNMNDNGMPAGGIEEDWETPQTLNETWGYSRFDTKWKSPEVVVRRLVEIVSQGGNYLLNIGPRGDGSIPEASAATLERVGAWMQKNGQSIHGAKASPFPVFPWGGCTVKENILYLHVLKRPADGTLELPGLRSQVRKAFLLADPGKNLESSRSASSVRISLPSIPADAINTVVALELDGPPRVDPPVITEAEGKPVVLDYLNAVTSGKTVNRFNRRGQFHISRWRGPADQASWRVRFLQPGRYRVHLVCAGSPGRHLRPCRRRPAGPGRIPASLRVVSVCHTRRRGAGDHRRRRAGTRAASGARTGTGPDVLQINQTRSRSLTRMMSHPVNRRRFLAATGSALAAGPLAAADNDSPTHRTTGLVDCQSHLFFPEVLDLMRRRQVEPLVYDRDGTTYLKMGDWLRKVPPPYVSVDAKLAAMDASGIEVTLLSTNDPGPEWFGEDGPAVAQLIHDSLAGVIAKQPKRFRGLCTLPLQNEAAAAAELDRCAKRLGFVGILLYTNLAGAWCDEPQFHWLYARAEELAVPILLHPAKPITTEQVVGYELTSTLGNMFENTTALARIIASGLLDRHPKLKLVCPHLGGTLPFICGRMDHQLAVLKRGPQNLLRKPSEYLRSIYMDIVSPLPEAMRFALDFSSADKLLFASDHPWVQPKEILEPLRSLRLPSAAETMILRDNARTLFRL